MLNLISAIQARLVSTKDDDRGAGLAEYGLLLFLIALACLIALTTLGTTIAGVFDDVSGAL